MKLINLILIFFMLLSPCIVGAATESKLTIIPTSPISNLTTPLKTLNSDDPVFNGSKSNISSVEITEKEVQPKVVTSSNPDGMSAGKVMIKEGLEYLIVDNINKVFVGVGGLQLGEENNTNRDASQVAIFAVVAHTIDPTRDPNMMATVATMRDIYIYMILILGAILALFLIYQMLNPDDAAKLVDDFTGNYTFIAPYDMAKYYITTCVWLLLGPTILYTSLAINNYMVEGQMLSVLDQVAFSSDNIILYLTMGFLWLVSMSFFAVRLVLIIINTYVWYFYGAAMAFKKIRWLGVLAIAYNLVFIFAQFAIIFVCCLVVSYATSQELAWYSLSFIYLGMFLVVVGMEIFFVSWPILLKILSPRTIITLVRLARYI